MSNSQIKAADILLRKTIPDLVRTELTGLNGGPLEHRMDVPAKETREEWLARQQLEASARTADGRDSSDLVH